MVKDSIVIDIELLDEKKLSQNVAINKLTKNENFINKKTNGQLKGSSNKRCTASRSASARVGAKLFFINVIVSSSCDP